VQLAEAGSDVRRVRLEVGVAGRGLARRADAVVHNGRHLERRALTVNALLDVAAESKRLVRPEVRDPKRSIRSRT
jgi:hypothetical protein